MFRRVLAALVVLAVAGALLVLLWPQLFGLQRTMGVAQVESFRGAAVVAAAALVVVLLLAAILSRPFRRLGSSIAVVLVAFALANTAVLATRGFGDGAFEKADAASVTVLSWNTLGGAPGAQVIAELAVQSRADIVSLPETTERTATAVATAMTAAGLPMRAHTIAFDHISNSRSTSVLVSTRLGGYHLDSSRGSTSTLPSVVLRPDDGSGPTIVGVHASAPRPDELANWASDLRWLRGACPGGDVIMAGDFNATLDHLSGLGTGSGTTLGSCIDAASRSRNAAVGTWPTSVPALLGAPIDHVLTTAGWRVSGMRVVQDHDGSGSDHRPILVQLRPAG